MQWIIKHTNATGCSLHELVSGQNLQTVLLPSEKCAQPILKDLERDGIQIEYNKHTIKMEEEYDKWKEEEDMLKRETEGVEDKERSIERMQIVDEGKKEEGTVEGAKEEMKRETKEAEKKKMTRESVELVVKEAERTNRHEQWKEQTAKVNKNVSLEEDIEGKLEGGEN